MPSRTLEQADREEIRAGIIQGHTDQQIAARIGVHRCTINREINRNGGRSDYRAHQAQQRADTKRRRPRPSMLATNHELRTHIETRLDKADSPTTISIELARGRWAITANISPETIYQGIYNRIVSTEHTPHLKRRRRKHRHHTNPDTNSLGDYQPIGARPAAAANRARVGHLEGDLIVGANNASVLITIADRKSRMLWLAPTRSKRADDVYAALAELFEQIPPPLRRTLTWDQGSEIARWRDLMAAVGIDIYIADPKSPWQRPTNEHLNGLVRRYVGKGTDLSVFTPTQLAAITHRINTTPRRILNWDTPANRYARAVAATT